MTKARRSATILALAIVSACAPFHPEFFQETSGTATAESRPTTEPSVATTTAPAEDPTSAPVAATQPVQERTGPLYLPIRGLQKKMTVAVEGELTDGVLQSERIAVKPADKEVEVKSTVDAVDVEGKSISIGGCTIRVPEGTKIVDEHGKELLLDELRRGDWVKAEAVYRDVELESRKLTRRPRKEGERDKIAGEIAEIERKKNRITIGGIRIDYREDAQLIWESKEAPPEELVKQAKRPPGAHPALARVRRIDSDNSRPDRQFSIDDLLTIGGEVRYDFEWRNNYDLRDDLERDRAVQTISTTLEVSAALSKHAAGFVSLYLEKNDEVTDENRTLDVGSTVTLYESFIVIDDFPVKGFGLEVGRQNFSEGRKWIYDKNMDAARLYFNTESSVRFEATIASVLWDADPEDKKVINLIFGVHAEPIEDQKLFAYVLHRENGQLIDYDRTHVGLELEGKVGGFQYWFDGAFEWGRELDQRPASFTYQYNARVAGYGIDFASVYVFEDLPFEPSFISGVAYGSGDNDPLEGSDGNFRQTGLNRNRSDYNGVASFEYLGDLTRFDLSNLIATTAGVGIRPFSRTSLDFIHHHYWQVQGANFLGPSRLRLSPTGNDTDLGDEFDVVVGLKYFSPFSVRVIAAYFHPGDAFRQNSGGPADDAWWVSLTVKYTF